MITKTYCKAAFNMINSSNKDVYKICCHAERNETISGKYKTSIHSPFEYYLSPEMEEIRNKMLIGEPIEGCEICYEMEETGGVSFRQSDFRSHVAPFPTDVQNLEIKLRIFGSACNLSCFMCHPQNSTTRKLELRKIQTNIFQGRGEDISVKREDYDRIVQDIMKHLELIDVICFIGGEPFLLPRQWEFVNMIPKEHRDRITIKYNTNLTVTGFKKWSIDDVIENFKKVELNVSVDHIKEKLEYIRYPIKYQEFEKNILKYKDNIGSLMITASILNVRELDQIVKYYRDMGFHLQIPSIVQDPPELSIKQIDYKEKLELIERYKHDKVYEIVVSELKRPAVPSLQPRFIAYMKELDALRGTDVNKVFGKIYD